MQQVAGYSQRAKGGSGIFSRPAPIDELILSVLDDVEGVDSAQPETKRDLLPPPEAVDPGRLLQRDRMTALGTLSAGVAHEINNPLTYLLINLEHVLRQLRAAGASDDPAAELTGGDREPRLAAMVQALQQSVEGANRIRKIVSDLQTFAQGNIERRAPVDVRCLLESATQMAWHEIRPRARLTKNLAAVPPVEANDARLGQVFLSLLVNAAHAIPEGDTAGHEVTVSTSTDEQGRAVIEVHDTGSGIAPEDLRRVFDPFFTTKGPRSAGLGLALSHGTVMGLGGEITASSAPGRGTTFRVVLPPAERWRCAGPPSGGEVRVAGRRRVLLIDDEKLLGDAIARALSGEHDVEVVTDAHQGLDRLLSGEAYDVVLCDLMMPGMTGMDLYAEVIRTDPELAARFVFMSGGTFSERARAFLESVPNPRLDKPLDLGRLRSIVERAKDA